MPVSANQHPNQIKRSVKRRSFIWLLTVMTLLGIAGMIGYYDLRNEVVKAARDNARRTTHQISGEMDAANTLYLSLAGSSMRVLQEKLLTFGLPRRVTAKVREASSPALFFGNQPMKDKFPAVDEAQGLLGAAAAIFVKDGERFVLLAARLPEGEPQADMGGSSLEHSDKAMESLRAGMGFRGVVEMQGKSYLAAYDPICEPSSGEMIGVWYTGYPIDALSHLGPVERADEEGAEAPVPDLRKIQSADKHLLELINDIFDLSKIEAGKMTLHLEDFSLAELMRDLAATAAPLAACNDNTLKIPTPAPEEAGEMHADLTKVRQMLLNLLSNACKFTKEGTVSLAFRRETAAGAEWIIFDVTDTGIGMDEEQQGRLFQDFSQADASTTRRYGGTGLGLAISKRFGELMGGTVTVRSAPGDGSTFTLRLPAHVTEPLPTDEQNPAAGHRFAETAAEAPAGRFYRGAFIPDAHASPRAISPIPQVSSAPGSSANSSRPRFYRGAPVVEQPAAVSAGTVLIIDDDPQVLELVRPIVAREGFILASAANGRDGLALARQLQPQLITLDVENARRLGRLGGPRRAQGRPNHGTFARHPCQHGR